MPPLALANLNFLGREHPSFQKLVIGDEAPVGKGSPVLETTVSWPRGINLRKACKETRS